MRGLKEVLEVEVVGVKMGFLVIGGGVVVVVGIGVDLVEYLVFDVFVIFCMMVLGLRLVLDCVVIWMW